MTQTVFLRLDTLVARASQNGVVLPAVVLTLCSAERLEFACVDEADTVGPVAGTGVNLQVSVKNHPNDTASLLLLASLSTTGSGPTYRYVAQWSDTDLDNDALRALLGSAFLVTGASDSGPWMEIAITSDGKTSRISFPITIKNAFLRPEDVGPDPRVAASETWLTARAVRVDLAQTFTADQQAQALANIGLNGIRSMTKTAGGFLELVDAGNNTFHIPLNAGSAPA